MTPLPLPDKEGQGSHNAWVRYLSGEGSEGMRECGWVSLATLLKRQMPSPEFCNGALGLSSRV
jgi:hypothetical protein